MLTRNDEKSNGSRIEWLDATKGFAALMVVLGHNLMGMLDEDLFASGAVFWQRVVNWVYSFHVFLFFFLAGYLFFRSCFSEGFSEQTRKKFRIRFWNHCVVYLAYSVLFWLARFLLAKYTRIHVDWTDLVKIPLVPMEMYWFLWVLIIFCLVGFPVLRLIEKRRWKHDFLWLLPALALSLASYCFPRAAALSALKQAAYYAIAFFAGAYFCRHGLGFLRKTAVFLCFLLISAAVTVGVLGFGWKPAAIPGCGILAAFILSMTLLRLFQLPKRCSVLALPGRYALEIFLLQHYAIGAVRRLIVRLALPVNALTVILSTLLEAAIPVALALLLKKLRLHRILFRPVIWYFEGRNDPSSGKGET